MGKVGNMSRDGNPENKKEALTHRAGARMGSAATEPREEGEGLRQGRSTSKLNCKEERTRKEGGQIRVLWDSTRVTEAPEEIQGRKERSNSPWSNVQQLPCRGPSSNRRPRKLRERRAG